MWSRLLFTVFYQPIDSSVKSLLSVFQRTRVHTKEGSGMISHHIWEIRLLSKECNENLSELVTYINILVSVYQYFSESCFIMYCRKWMAKKQQHYNVQYKHLEQLFYISDVMWRTLETIYKASEQFRYLKLNKVGNCWN